ncbi:hypothetical protein [Hydrogenophaga sp.]|jgi:hypothetical protein|uniref:hypothetical protein n=1 Tax=Hydrogenophaga sp. TaxID=1904254 RepID=UPI0027344EB4|nr:hypothetical protein [Hydrogenophaga sp.]MDP3883933.1 hypothetical protein [Hydrogenophaga sp.]MDZ4357894.1 hypothetical protein [Variovorax sp.]
MRTLIAQTQKALEAELYYVALFTALSIPDIAAALESSDGRASGKRYAAWYEEWVRPRLKESRGRENPLTGEACYGFRCALLHQGRSQRTNDQYSHIMFVEPGHPNYSIHDCLVSGKALLIQLDEFVMEVLRGGELWLKSVQGTEPFEQNYSHFAKRRPQGLRPYVVGAPVVG